MATLGTQLSQWSQPYEAAGQTASDHWPQILTDIAAAGLAAIEPTIATESDVRAMATLCAHRGISVPSFVVPCRLDEAEWEAAATHVLDVATAAKSALSCDMVAVSPGAKNPSAPAGKSDEQLIHQAEALRWLANRLDRRGVQLAYHATDAAMQYGAREFHHMMVATRNVAMKLSLDVQGIYSGCGNSRVAVQDAITLYGDRTAIVHIRQSARGITTEYLTDGDIDYVAVFRHLKRFDFSGPVYLATTAEAGAPATVSLIESHRRSLRYLRDAIKRGV